MKRIFVRERVNLYLRPYDIIITSTNSGIIGRLFRFRELKRVHTEHAVSGCIEEEGEWV